MHRTPRRTNRPRLEALEPRALLAGNVTVAFSDGDVVITGDNASNAIEIFQVSLDRYRVVGRSAGGSATRINDSSTGFFDFVLNSREYNDDLRINMRGGNDSVTIRGDAGLFGANDIDVPDDLVIDMGSGNDRVDLQFVQAQRGDILIELGTGTDTVSLSNVVVQDDLRVTRPSSTNSRTTVNLNRVDVASTLDVSLGAGTDIVNINDSRAQDLRVRLREGNDRLNIKRTTILRNSLLDGGSGTDRLNRFRNNVALNHQSFETLSSNDINF